jgi:hypothetical protein
MESSNSASGKRREGKFFARGGLTILVSSIIMLYFLASAGREKLPLLDEAEAAYKPFLFSLLGIAIYVMSSAKDKRNRFDPQYVPDYFFRGAQAMVYLYVIILLMAKNAGDGGGSQTGGGPADSTAAGGGAETLSYDFSSWPPNLIGLFVGMFIIHVERAMEGLGRLFAQIVGGVLPRSLLEQTTIHRDAEQLGNVNRFAELRAQAYALLPLVPEVHRHVIRGRLEQAEATATGRDPNAAANANRELAALLEEVRTSIMEYTVSFADVAKNAPP